MYNLTIIVAQDGERFLTFRQTNESPPESSWVKFVTFDCILDNDRAAKRTENTVRRIGFIP